MRRTLRTALWISLFAQFGTAHAQSGPAPFPFDLAGKAPISKTYASPWKIICTNPGMMQAGATSAATVTDSGETDRINCMTIGPLTQVKLGLLGREIISGTEDNLINTVFYRGAIEYPDGQNSTPPCFTGQNAIYSTAPSGTSAFATGCPWIPVYPGESVKETNALPIVIPGNSNFRIRYGVFVAVPPATAAVVGSSSSGALAATTQYFYKGTCVKAGAESGPSAETSASTTGTVLNVNVTLTYPTTPVGCDSYKIYRSTTTGVEVFLTTIPVPQAVASATTIFADAGQIAPGSGTPPVANRWPKTSFIKKGDSTTTSGAAGNSTDVVSAAGTLNMVTAGAVPPPAFISTPVYVLGDDVGAFPVCLVSDSIGSGRGTQINSAENNLSQVTGNYFNQVMTPGIYHSLNLSISGTTMGGFVSGTNFGGDTARLGMLEGCAYEVVTLSDNDLIQNATWQQLAGYTMSFAKSQVLRGKKIYVTTLAVFNSSNDNGISGPPGESGQTSEPQRKLYNTWVRSGAQTSPFSATTGSIATTTLTVTGTAGGAPSLAAGQVIFIPGIVNNTMITALLTGTGGDGTYTVNNSQVVSGALTATVPVSSGGTPFPYISDYWDLEAAEGVVDLNGVPTLNGGFFAAGVLLGAGTFSGVPTTTTQPFSAISGVGTITAHSLIGITVKVTSGAAIGQSCVIAENTTANMTCNGGPSINLTIAPAAGDTFNVYATNTNDGQHPTLTVHTMMATGVNPLGLPNFQTFANTHFGGF